MVIFSWILNRINVSLRYTKLVCMCYTLPKWKYACHGKLWMNSRPSTTHHAFHTVQYHTDNWQSLWPCLELYPFPQQRLQRWWRPWTWIKVYLFSYLREGERTEEQILCRLNWTLWLSAFIRSYNSLVYMNYTVSGDQILQSSWLVYQNMKNELHWLNCTWLCWPKNASPYNNASLLS